MADDAFPLSRDHWTFGALWQRSWDVFRRDWVTPSVAMLLFFAASFAVGLVSEILSLPFAGLDHQVAAAVIVVVAQVVSFVVQGVFGMGLIRIALDMHQGQKADLARLFSQLPKLGRYVVQQLVIAAVFFVALAVALALVGGVALAAGALSWEAVRADPVVVVPAVVVAMLLLAVPALYYGLPLVLATFELVHDDGASAMGSLRSSYVLARGHRLAILGIMLVAGLVVIVGVLACCIGLMPAGAFVYVLLAGLYLTLRNGSALPRIAPPGGGPPLST